MKHQIYNHFLNSKLPGFEPGEYDFILLSKFKFEIGDASYFEFIIDSTNGGFFFDKAIQIYGYSSQFDFNDITYINTLLRNEYGSIFNGLTAFGQELFGNQFCFDETTNNIIFFQAETGEREIIAKNFLEWIALYLMTWSITQMLMYSNSGSVIEGR